jgi:hypothetical protein
MRVEISYYGYNPCPFCWPRKTRFTGTVLEIKPGWIKMNRDCDPENSWHSFDLNPGMTIKVLPDEAVCRDGGDG